MRFEKVAAGGWILLQASIWRRTDIRDCETLPLLQSMKAEEAAVEGTERVPTPQAKTSPLVIPLKGLLASTFLKGTSWSD